MDTNAIRIDKEYVKKLLPERAQNSNKGTFGTVLNIAGSVFYSGAAVLSSLAALRCGAGVVRLASETDVIQQIASFSPDITFIDLGFSEQGCIPKNALKYIQNLKTPSAVSIGCGLTTLPPVKAFLEKFLETYTASPVPIVIDADAINILSLMQKPIIPLNSVITPHPAELSRLIKISVSTIQQDRIKWADYACKQLDCIVVLKGHETVIAIPNGNTFVNTTGNSSLAHAGSGDVLCGMIAGFAAQGVKLEDASVLAVYLHGLAGMLASVKLTEYSVLASDLLNFIPNAIKEFV
ncbi:MAG: NAD(P)H-hydrate dehydratase [Candidatus Gastranaerophilales bacterium]|nr:NAD(P)H-hydrate dehydratase [Candidatus Gastranaerophilales bacterium]